MDEDQQDPNQDPYAETDQKQSLRNRYSSPVETKSSKWHSKINGMGASVRRLQLELTELTLHPPANCSAGPKGDNIYQWVATILGPAGSVYQGGVFFLELEFTNDYPFKPPTVTFRTRVYHCNINSKGAICLDLLNENWSPTTTISQILQSICNLLKNCIPSKPLVDNIALLYFQDKSRHDEIARQWTQRFAT
ncbi:uncharacterized protein TRIADDRAFT_26380 [Trichoplax adhaerens]|uniref:UBC core domain-containing protein n=1 Tax=Trichoplax adhaerens TaxID=10228 RepID=B3S0M9_TRIAD|nr:hypothetical protein TRIADDRAFT_26380 [Trichoplax adhaerens]EDV24039.1 hypothetical protein TRIADDRAFT_26380 [Trichoplax adhaerens]|eukprot:XP_002113565.1 hypothetical protein TRIADDRAFT_26380 [Trichoplax adhaerens]